MNPTSPMTKVGDLVEHGVADLQTGPFGTQLKASEYVDSGVPVINVRNIGFGNVRDADLEFVTPVKAEKLEVHQLEEGDIVFGRKGAVERHALIGPEQAGWVQGSDCLRVRITSKAVCERYVSYYLRTQAHQDWMNALCSFGATMASLNQDIVKRISIPLPCFSVQRKIAAILTAYDDLIETNKRRIALLEKMAEELYREWFVRMRFPGHQNAQFVKGVPEGWELKRFTELVEMNPRELIGKSDLAPFVGMDSLSRTSMHFVSKEVREGPSGSKFRNRDTLLPRITPCLENGKRGFVSCLGEEQVGVGSTEFIVFREKVLPAEYIYLLSCNASFRQHAELSMTGASGRQRVQNDCFDYFFVPEPPGDVLRKFVENVGPLFDSVGVLAAQVSVLSNTRDLLLPRLISGKLSVEDLDIQFPSSMRDE